MSKHCRKCAKAPSKKRKRVGVSNSLVETSRASLMVAVVLFHSELSKLKIPPGSVGHISPQRNAQPNNQISPRTRNLKRAKSILPGSTKLIEAHPKSCASNPYFGQKTTQHNCEIFVGGL